MYFPLKKIDYCVWVIAGLVFLSALTKIKLLWGILNQQELWAQVLTIGLFVSAVLGFVGLVYLKKWGFYFVYIYLVIATFFFSISVLPFFLSIFDLDVKTATWQLLTINFGTLAFTVFLHVAKSKDRSTFKEAS